MICRIWRAETSALKAQAYEDAALSRVIPSIEARELPGFLKIDLLRRRQLGGNVQFATLMWFDRPEDIVAFSGVDAEGAYLPQDITAVLDQYDVRAMHYELIAQRLQGSSGG